MILLRFDYTYAIEHFTMILKYAGMTMKIAVISMVFALIFSLIITIIRYYRIRVLHIIVNVYIDLFRGAPLLVQLFFIYYGLAQLFPIFVNLSGEAAAVIGLTLNAASYMTEEMRSALESVPRGQIEGGLSVGMTEMQVMRHITLPQAARIAMPMMGNEFISLVKNTSMAFTLGVREIMAESSLLGTSSGRYFECYLDAFIIYFILCKVIGILQKLLEKRLNRQGGVQL